MKLIFYDFEVFKYFWNVVLIDYETRETTIIMQNPNQLREFYESNVDSIWIGYNSRQFDQYVLKGILVGKDPFEITTKIIVDDISGHQLIPNHSEIPLNNFDVSTGFHSLKQLEGFMGSRIKETDVPFDLDRPLTEEEITQVIDYCIHDVEETIKVFKARREEFDSQLSLIETFELPMEMFNKTKAQLSAHVLGAHTKKEYNDEFDLMIPDNLVISEKYSHVLKWYQDKKNLNYTSKLLANICGVDHIFAWGGIHGAVDNYCKEGNFIMSDIASMYPATMIEYNFLSRNVENPAKFREIRDTRIELKKNKDPRQLPMKIVLNSTYGASKDKHNNLYDPLMANNVCVVGQLFILDLLDKIEPYVELVQSNTDGILVRYDTEEQKQAYFDECEKWCKRSRFDLEHDEYVKVIQKDVNNYIIVDSNGKYKSKGAYVKKLSPIDYNLPIVNKALVDYFIKEIPPQETIMNCNNLHEFQTIVKVSKLYKHAVKDGEIIKERVLRVFASTEESHGSVFKVKSEERVEKIANTPEKCFIYNDDVVGKPVPDNLDRQYYIDMAEKRIQDFLSKDKKNAKPKSDIKGINLIVKSEVEEFLLNDESDSVFEFIKKLKDEVLINKTQFEIMCKLGFFDSYGNSKYVLKCFNLYVELIGRKNFKFSKLDKFSEIQHLLPIYAENSTDTQYTNVDMEKLLIKKFKEIADMKGFSLKQKLLFETEYYGHPKFINNKFPKHAFYVTELTFGKNKTTPRLQLYSLKTGDVVKTRITNSELYIGQPIQVGHIISAEFTDRKMNKLVDGKWVRSNETEKILVNYEVY